jgi:hypothetical protein
VTAEPRTYRFGDASAPGILLGLPLRQAAPVIAGVVWLAGCLQTPVGVPGGLLGLAAGAVVAFGRWRGSALFDVAGPGARLALGARTGPERPHYRSSRWSTGPPATAGSQRLPLGRAGGRPLQLRQHALYIIYTAGG